MPKLPQKMLKIRKVFNRDSFSFKGEPFSFGIVSLLDGVIEQVVSYAKARRDGFHHLTWGRISLIDQINEGNAVVFWFQAGEPWCWNGAIEGNLRNQIMAQCKKEDSDEKTR